MARTWEELVFLKKHKQNTILWNKNPLQSGERKCLLRKCFVKWFNSKDILLMTLTLVLLYQNLILGLQVNIETISLCQKSPETHFALNLFLFSIHKACLPSQKYRNANQGRWGLMCIQKISFLVQFCSHISHTKKINYLMCIWICAVQFFAHPCVHEFKYCTNNRPREKVKYFKFVSRHQITS